MENRINLDSNIINWYPFKENAKIINVIDISDLNEKFDYIIINISNKNIDAKEVLIHAKDCLLDNGRIIIIANNKFGISNWVNNEIEISELNDLTKNKIDNILNELNFKYTKYYYIMPDIENVNVIFTDNTMPNPENISRNLSMHFSKEVIKENENKLIQQLIKNDKNSFKFFANSYFIEVSNDLVEDNNVNFVSFSNLRKEKYRIKTVVTKDKVYKNAASIEAKEHIQNIKKNIDTIKNIGFNMLDNYENDTIISKFVNEETLDKELINLLNENNTDMFFNIINNFKEILLKIPNGEFENSVFEKYNINIEKGKKENLHFLKHGFWDLIFQNCFYIDNEFYFYDQEWYEENVPLEFILYRAIIYLQNILDEKTKNEVLEKYNIVNFITEFKELDDKLQIEIRDEDVWKKHINYIEFKDLKKDYDEAKRLNEERMDVINFFKKENEDLRNQVANFDNVMKEKDDIINRMINSKSWKITEPIRKITGKFSKN